MNVLRATGPDAGVVKYDVLTALSVAGLNGSPTLQMSMMRLIALVTARYNWGADEFVVGQRDMARMWSVNERTVKREIKRLSEAQIILCKRPGVRGRVGAYRLNQSRIAALSQPCWHRVGPDFEARMQARYAQQGDVKVVQISAYAEKEPAAGTSAPAISAKAGTWERAMDQLARQEPHQFEAWFAKLGFKGLAHGTLTLRCESIFAQRYIEAHLTRPLIRTVEEELGPIERIAFVRD